MFRSNRHSVYGNQAAARLVRENHRRQSGEQAGKKQATDQHQNNCNKNRLTRAV